VPPSRGRNCTESSAHHQSGRRTRWHRAVRGRKQKQEVNLFLPAHFSRFLLLSLFGATMRPPHATAWALQTLVAAHALVAAAAAAAASSVPAAEDPSLPPSLADASWSVVRGFLHALRDVLFPQLRDPAAASASTGLLDRGFAGETPAALSIRLSYRAWFLDLSDRAGVTAFHDAQPDAFRGAVALGTGLVLLVVVFAIRILTGSIARLVLTAAFKATRDERFRPDEEEEEAEEAEDGTDEGGAKAKKRSGGIAGTVLRDMTVAPEGEGNVFNSMWEGPVEYDFDPRLVGLSPAERDVFRRRLGAAAAAEGGAAAAGGRGAQTRRGRRPGRTWGEGGSAWALGLNFPGDAPALNRVHHDGHRDWSRRPKMFREASVGTSPGRAAREEGEGGALESRCRGGDPTHAIHRILPPPDRVLILAFFAPSLSLLFSPLACAHRFRHL
jgi:hypothetical protein